MDSVKLHFRVHWNKLGVLFPLENREIGSSQTPKWKKNRLAQNHKEGISGSQTTGGWLNHPFEKYARQFGSFPQVGVKKKQV